MPYDYKKAYKQYYQPGAEPELVTVPPTRYVAVRGQGDPNEPDGGYARALGVLYAVAYTLRMSAKAGRAIEGFFDYVVPPLEGFWWQPGVDGMDYGRKAEFHWISVIRLPDFVTRADFDWAVAEATRKKKLDCSGAELLTLDEGLCAQVMHTGAFDDEPATVARLDAFIREQGCVPDFTDARLHHEIYLSDPRKTAQDKRRTVIRHPARRA